jgi:two-component system, cell cycle sensor histidine kinase and response regulator CckA
MSTPSNPDPRAPGDADAALPRGNETVLIVDDDETVRRTTCRMLQFAGYRALQGACGRDGLELYQREGSNVDLVILDLAMPGMSGLEVLARLQTLDPQVKVIILSGYAPDAADEATVQAYIQKPMSATELLTTIRSVLDASSP